MHQVCGIRAKSKKNLLNLRDPREIKHNSQRGIDTRQADDIFVDISQCGETARRWLTAC